MDPLQYCLNYKIMKKIFESFGDHIPVSVIIIGDPSLPENRRKQKWFDDVVEFDRKRRKFLGY